MSSALATNTAADRHFHDALELLARAAEEILRGDPQLGNSAVLDRLRAQHPHEFAVVFEAERHGPGGPTR